MATIDPWGSELAEDYEKIIKQFGLEEFNPKLFPNSNRIMRRGVAFAGRGLKPISDAIKKKQKFYVLTGIMPSADRIHFGTKMVIENVRYFQEKGAKAYVLVADLEAAATRGVSIEEARKRAMDFHIPAYIALGLDPKKTVFYFQSENKKVMHLAFEFAKKITLNEFKAIYGIADPGRIMSACLQAGDMVFPQLEERMPGIIPVGIDQDPHIRLCRDIIARTKSKYNFTPISSIYHKFTPSLDGEMKMSKSRPESMIELPEDTKSAVRKIKNAKTGGRDSLELQKKLGGEPEKCIVFEMYKQHLIEDDKILGEVCNDCKKGILMCGEDKKNACAYMESFMDNFIKQLEAARKTTGKLNFINFK